MATQTIHRQIRTAAAPADVYRLLADSATWPTWTPIDSCEITLPGTSTQPEERIFRNGRHRIHERVIEKTPNEAVAYTLLGGLAVKDYLARILLAPIPGGTEIIWHTTFTPKMPGTGWLYRRALDRATEEFMQGLAQHATTPSA